MSAALDPVGRFAVRHRLVLAALVAVLALSGCDHLPKRFLVPVAVPCQQEMPEEPVWATEALPENATIWEQVLVLLAERRQRIAYEEQLRVRLEACRASPAAAGLNG